ncbi:hypothetical protein [Nocardia vaccinii]|uniref:hypothetical protein n=1 Tax=Nocardia vaccinii TaxID=1822 RepID=UPI0012F4A002|nr:hypothetical protein [Nocardia vaccinii]
MPVQFRTRRAVPMLKYMTNPVPSATICALADAAARRHRTPGRGAHGRLDTHAICGVVSLPPPQAAVHIPSFDEPNERHSKSIGRLVSV